MLDVHQSQEFTCFDNPFSSLYSLNLSIIVNLDFIFVYIICLRIRPVYGLPRRVNTPHEIEVD